MKKSNLATLSFFMILIFAAGLFMVHQKKPVVTENIVSGKAVDSGERPFVPPDLEEKSPIRSVSEEKPPMPSVSEEKPPMPSVSEEKPPVPAGDALFIGDSRTVGLWEYGSISGADFFASEGMSVYNIHKKPLSVPGVGRVTLTELLDNKQYAKIYIMLGINELGYNLEKTAVKYKELVAFIKEKQPEAYLFLQANLHVSKKRSERDTVINNGAINNINARIAELADDQEIFYLDANVLFNDGNGNLAADKTEDEAHPYGKYYAGWSDWIIQQTAAKG